jgi:propionyl-CoA carboxylase alpha chain
MVANRGEIAGRVFSTCRRMGIGTIAVHSDADAKANFVREADLAVCIGGSSPVDSYLRQDLLVEAALRAGADAVHPGYGFLAESAGFARAVLDAGLIWIGPAPETIEAMGSKILARATMAAAGVPVLPGAQITEGTSDELNAIAAEVGYPLLIKASAGGGGKGMRLVTAPSQLADAAEQARREAGAAFGDETVFLERYAKKARHVEIQILGDFEGTVISVFERDCSIQRRFQKLIEECPSPAVSDELRAKLQAAAATAGRTLAYLGAGTVEFLVAERRFYFLEVNTRLQVEHPVTELVTGLDLVALQIQIAEGKPLPREATNATITGHAIEARVYAEDPAKNYLPTAGKVSRIRFSSGVRVDTATVDGDDVSPHYDPLLAKVIAHGATRDSALRKLTHALTRAEIHGIATNRDLLVGILESEEFRAGDADTSFLDADRAERLSACPLDAEWTALAATAAALAQRSQRRRDASALRTIPGGWRNNPSMPQVSIYSTPTDELLRVEYEFNRDGQLSCVRSGEFEWRCITLRECDPTRVTIEVGGLARKFWIARDGLYVHVNCALGQISFVLLPRFPTSQNAPGRGSLLAPMPGVVVRILATPGDRVTAGQPLVVLEAMKMEHEILAPFVGTLTEVFVTEGAHIDATTPVAVIAADDEKGAA